MDNQRNRIEKAFTHRGLKRASIMGYTSGLNKFLKTANLKLEDLNKLPIDEIEDKTKEMILSNVGILAPKYLNLILNAVKTYLYFSNRIRSRKAFIELKFDKSSTLENGLLVEMLENEDLSTMFKLASAKKKIVLGLCGLGGLRPSIVPILKVKHIHKNFYTLKDGKIKLARPVLMIIPNLETDKQGRSLRDKLGRTTKIEGNKAKLAS